MMQLTQGEIKLFFKNMFDLMWRTNERRKIVPPFPKPILGKANKAPFDDIAAVSQALWEDPTTIDEYLADPGDAKLTEKDRSIISDWRQHFLKGKFIVYRIFDNYSIMLTPEEPVKIYRVFGLTGPMRKLSPLPPPYMAETVLLPFCGKITFNSHLLSQEIVITEEYMSQLDQRYSEINAQSGITANLIGEKISEPPKTGKKAQAKSKNQKNQKKSKK